MPTYTWECNRCHKQIDTVSTVALRHIGPRCCGTTIRVITPAYSMPDIAPYMAVTGDRAGMEISGRAAHREYLKRNGLIELGNEKLTNKAPDFRPAKGAIREELHRVVPQVMGKYRG